MRCLPLLLLLLFPGILTAQIPAHMLPDVAVAVQRKWTDGTWRRCEASGPGARAALAWVQAQPTPGLTLKSTGAPSATRAIMSGYRLTRAWAPETPLTCFAIGPSALPVLALPSMPVVPPPVVPPPVVPPVTSAPPPIPALAEWERKMQVYGRHHGDPAVIDLTKLWEGAAWYYDGTRVFYQMADYTGSAAWNLSAQAINNMYRAYVLSTNGGIQGWRVFPHGLYMDYKRTGDEQSKDAAILLAKNSAYARAGGGAWEGLSRETAFCINAYLVAELLGEPRHPKLDTAVEYALGHINEWFVQNTSASWAPFMFGLTSEALITYYQQVTPDPRILAAIKLGLDETWKRAWIEKDQAFFYRADAPSTGAPDLNLLVAPVFAWMYQQTGDVTYRDRGDQAFAGGVAKAYLEGGKHFSQSYRSAFDYVQWRLKVPWSGDKTAPKVSNIQTSVAGTSVVVNWATDEAADTQIEYGLSPAALEQNTPRNALLVTGHSQTLTNLEPGTTYSYRVRSADAHGNIGYSEVGEVTASAQDVMLPVITGVQHRAINHYTIWVEWRTDEDADSQVEWGLDTTYGQVTPLKDTPLARWHIIKFTFKSPADWLKIGRTYHYTVKSRDAAGNLSTSQDMTFVVP